MPSLEEQTKSLPRHERLDELRSHADDPTPQKTRRIEWVGQLSPYDNPLIVARLLAGLYTPLQEQAIRKAAAHARTRGQKINGRWEAHRTRLVEHDHAAAQVVFKQGRGLTKTYIWEPANDFICDVAYADVDVILGSDVGDEFRDLDDPDRKPDPHFLVPPEESVFLQTRNDRIPVNVAELGTIAKT